jgi:hypothetical protein
MGFARDGRTLGLAAWFRDDMVDFVAELNAG